MNLPVRVTEAGAKVRVNSDWNQRHKVTLVRRRAVRHLRGRSLTHMVGWGKLGKDARFPGHLWTRRGHKMVDASSVEAFPVTT